MFSKIKKLSKKVKFVLVSAALMAASCLTALADTVTATPAPITVDYSTPLSTAFNSCVTNTINCFSLVIPIALTVFACKFVWIKSVSFFSRMSSKS